MIPANDTEISGTVLLEDLKKRPVIMLGESHSDAEHHMWQLHTLSALYGQNQNMVIGFESFNRAQQPILDRWTKGELSRNKFLELTRWDKIWGYDSNHYMPLFHFARMNRVPMLALNIERSLIQKVSRFGWNSIPKDQRQGISTPLPPSKSYTNFLTDSFSMHSNIDAKNLRPKKVNTKKLSRFIEAQTIWDRAMAEAIAKARRSSSNPQVVVIVGSGHLKYGYGIPHQLANLGIKNGVVLLPWNKELSCTELKNSKGTPIAHAIFGVDRLIEKEKHYRPLLGVQVRIAGKKLVITEIAEGSVAELARLQKNDIIVSAAGTKISEFGELIAIIKKQVPGTYLPLRVIRDGIEIDVIAKFPTLSMDVKHQ